MANPDPEIGYNAACSARKILSWQLVVQIIQIKNNVFGFPFIFRGALDVKATSINEQMKMAAVKAIAD